MQDFNGKMIQGSRISKNEGGLSQFQKNLLETD